MRKISLKIFIVCLALGLWTCAVNCRGESPTNAISKQPPKHLLVVTVTKGYRHASIAAGERVVAQLAKKTGAFDVDFVRTDDDMAKKMTAAALQRYDGVFFLNTTGILPLPDKAAFLDWIKSGKGFIGTHSATDTFHGKAGEIDPYIDMIGGEFLEHTVAQVDCIVQDAKHPATRHFGKTYQVFDEIYILKNFDRKKVHGLLALDKRPGIDEPGYYPISWCKKYGRGNVFYTALGHEDAVWESPQYQLHLLGGIKWALGLEAGDVVPQGASVNSKALP